jgi:hypothetical protein
MNTIGFSATNISDALARRSATVAEITNKATAASNAASDLKKLRDERDGITEKRTVQAIKLQLVGDRKKVDRIDRDAFDVTVGCTRLTADITSKACDAVLSLVKALAAANRRDELTRKIEKAEAKNSPAEGNENSNITSVDPQTEAVPKLVAWITRNKIEPTSDDIALVRILGLTVPPCLAGLFFMFATALLAMEKVK